MGPKKGKRKRYIQQQSPLCFLVTWSDKFFKGVLR